MMRLALREMAPTRAVTAPTRRLCTAPPRAVEHDGTLAQRTLVLLKPDAVERRLVGRLLQRFEDRGLALVGLRQRVAPRSLAEAHYDEHRAKPSSSARVFLASGPSWPSDSEACAAAVRFPDGGLVPAAVALEPWVYETPGAAITFD
ncbi:nucleoside diphosphate kinase [Aureococcus anophagefferens]|nr:nucleoside diphosphate kinase [Aureococcus anophagefferens]